MQEGAVYRANLWAAEKVRPDRLDLLGMSVCLIGAAIIAFGHRITVSGGSSQSTRPRLSALTLLD